MVIHITCASSRLLNQPSFGFLNFFFFFFGGGLILGAAYFDELVKSLVPINISYTHSFPFRDVWAVFFIFIFYLFIFSGLCLTAFISVGSSALLIFRIVSYFIH